MVWHNCLIYLIVQLLFYKRGSLTTTPSFDFIGSIMTNGFAETDRIVIQSLPPIYFLTVQGFIYNGSHDFILQIG